MLDAVEELLDEHARQRVLDDEEEEADVEEHEKVAVRPVMVQSVCQPLPIEPACR